MITQELISKVKEEYKKDKKDKTLRHGASGDFQELCEELVNREVIYCVSQLVSHMQEIDPNFYDEYYNLLGSEDYNDNVDYYIRNMSREDATDILEREFCIDCSNSSIEELREALYQNLIDEDKIQEFANDHNIEPTYNEVFEYWLVSNWLADKLKGHGEIIEKDLYGLTIWGRQTTGQAIYIDGVICRIVKDLYLKEEN